MAPEMSLVAQKIYSICINLASVERLYSFISIIYSKQRNCLKHLALPVSYDQESSQNKSQLFNENKLQSESDHSISLSDNDDSEIYEEDEETIKESNEESQFTDLKSEQEEVIVHPINKPKGNGSLKLCLSTH
ncbi:hypothetical protein F8M41_008493 [Gigaspora margarita]|uniref:Uncharacterized protein n=1 Tax=Gigaspora margarita TaxID=4874 RepID=A0A8H3X3D0_GIGMA|nr:hypothetical protein F8M41_008493 [Gigaspora margarita]